MKVAIISPHLDDAIFSLGEYILNTHNDITIITPMGGIPDDKIGREKYEILHKEHIEACVITGVNFINGPFLDDVYPRIDENLCRQWIKEQITHDDLVIIPLGIYHPDHVLIRRLCDDLNIENKMYYSELPYATDYPGLNRDLSKNMFKPESAKFSLVTCYKSQTGSDVVDRVMQKENLWVM